MPRPLAGVVEQVAEHLVEILALDRERDAPAIDVHVDGNAAIGVQPRRACAPGASADAGTAHRAPGVAPDAAARACAR